MASHLRVVFAFVIAAVTLAPAFGQPDAEGPRPGTYRIYTIPTAKGIPLFLGSFDIEKGGRYKSYLPGGRMTSEGTYQYDAASKTVVWKTGQYKDDKWGGRFFAEREGKTHVIYLTPSTRATSSIDAK